MMKNNSFLLVILFLAFSCRKPQGDDLEMYQYVNNQVDFKYIKNGDFQATNDASGHDNPFYRTRLNTIAWSAWNGQSPIATGTKFPDGSVNIKDIHKEKGGSVDVWTVMEKKAGVWRWSAFNKNGKVLVSNKNSKSKCQDCHSVGVDYTRGL